MRNLITSFLILMGMSVFGQETGTLFKDRVNNWMGHDYVAVYNTPQQARYVLIGYKAHPYAPDSIYFTVMSDEEWVALRSRVISNGGILEDNEFVTSIDGVDFLLSKNKDPDTGDFIMSTLFGAAG